MLGKLTRIALLGGLVLLVSTVLAASAYAETTAYGNVNFTAIYTLGNTPKGNGDLGIDIAPPIKDGPGDGGGGAFTLHAAASKFGVKSSADTDMGKVTAVIEVDAAGRVGSSLIGSDSSAPPIRLRHAYGTLGNLLLGRTWGGLATDFSWFPAVLDAAGPYGASVVYSDPRMAQVRYTVPMGDNKFVISAEENSGVRTNIQGSFTGDRPGLPRLVPAFYMNLGMAKVQVVAAMTTWRVAEQNTTDFDGDGKSDGDITASGTAFGANAAVNVGAGVVKFHFLTGGAGAQMYSQTVAGTANFQYGATPLLPVSTWKKTNATTGKSTLEVITGTDITLSYSHNLGDDKSVNFTYGSIAVNDAKDAGLVAESGSSIHLNYKWAAAPGVGMGVEYGSKTLNYNKDTSPSGKAETATSAGVIFVTDFAF